jgi:hypothetical protein
MDKMANLTPKEKEAIKFLINQELEKFENQKGKLKDLPEIPFLAVEERYDVLLKGILKKLK